MNKEKFLLWLRQNGAEVMAATNSYEFARFRARGGVHVIYEGRRGISADGFASECVWAFQDKKQLNMGVTAKPRSSYAKVKAAIAARDGMDCFFCGVAMKQDDFTVEHLVSLDKGGPNHVDNMALAHAKCNNAAANLPLIEKIKMRERMRNVQPMA